MNLFLDANKWGDNNGSPPIWWTGTRYEILINNDGSASGYFKISTTNPAVEGDTIKFSYNVSNWDPEIGYSDGYINIVSNGGSVVASVNFVQQPSGEISFECVAGNYYEVVVAYGSSDYYSGSFYDFEAILTPTPEPEPEKVKPWWLCDTKPTVTPCPVRPTTFIPFSQYDSSFTFPQASSRVPMKLDLSSSECVACNPEQQESTDPDPDPGSGGSTDDCWFIPFSFNDPGFKNENFSIESDDSNLPDWFDTTKPVIISFGSYGTTAYTPGTPDTGSTPYSFETGAQIDAFPLVGTLYQGQNSICLVFVAPG